MSTKFTASITGRNGYPGTITLVTDAQGEHTIVLTDIANDMKARRSISKQTLGLAATVLDAALTARDDAFLNATQCDDDNEMEILIAREGDHINIALYFDEHDPALKYAPGLNRFYVSAAGPIATNEAVIKALASVFKQAAA